MIGWQLLPALALVFAASAAICAVLILALRPSLQRYALAHPNKRSSHITPTPQGGGIAVMAATLAVTGAACATDALGASLQTIMLILAATGAMAVVGAIDDIRTIQVTPRLAMQTLLVAAAIYGLPREFSLFPLPWWIERLVFVIAGIWFVNLTNFMDGLDWLTAAWVVPVSAGLVIIGLSDALPREAVIAAAALGGAIIGFAPFNSPVARLFLGDVGSLPIGLLLGWLLATLAAEGQIAAAVLLPLYAMADTTLTLFARLAKGAKPWEAHRTHFYQRATANGFSVREVAARVFALHVGLAALAVMTVWLPGGAVKLTALAAGVCATLWLLFAFTRPRR